MSRSWEALEFERAVIEMARMDAVHAKIREGNQKAKEAVTKAGVTLHPRVAEVRKAGE